MGVRSLLVASTVLALGLALSGATNPGFVVLAAEAQSWMLMQFWGRTGAALAMCAKGSIALMSPSAPAAVSTESVQSTQALQGAGGCTQVATGETPA
ncbi:Bactericidal permeability-increasing protein [Aix galericulata]|nr:Bactericidal permeability-increasing protein [Aix galericulata]